MSDNNQISELKFIEIIGGRYDRMRYQRNACVVLAVALCVMWAVERFA